METSRSPRTVLELAWQLAAKVFPDYASKFSRHDFTFAQLFACLVVREQLKLSYRKAEAFFRDVPEWLAAIGMSSVPDHNTLWRAFGTILKKQRVHKMLDNMVGLFEAAKMLKLSTKPLAIDSTCFAIRYRSYHYDRVCRKLKLKPGEKYCENRDKTPDERRSAKVKQLPKLAIAIASGCHAILAIKAITGGGSDAPDFDSLLVQSWGRAKIKIVVADAGFDSEKNHRISRVELGIVSIIPAKIGRPTKKLPSGPFRRMMKKRFAKKADKKIYGQRSQVETVNSMIKRNLGDGMRSRKKKRQRQEMMLRILTHNLMLLANIED